MSEPLRVLVPLLSHDAGGIPDLRLMYDEMARTAPVAAEPYSTTAALSGGVDIIHVHWPEWLIRRDRGPVTLAADSARVLAELGVAKARGAKIVWTTYNIRPHETDRLGLVDSFVHAFSRLVDQVVCPSATALDQIRFQYPALVGLDQRVIPHGTYRGVYPDERLSAQQAREKLGLPPDRRVALQFGLVRAYKNVPQLLRCYAEVRGQRDDTFLLIAGNPLPDALGEEIQRLCAGMTDARADLRRIPEDEVQLYLRAANCVVIGTSFAVNSAVAMLSLSFDRPVLMPNRGAAVDYRDAAGSAWVHTYDGGMRAAVLNSAFDIEQPPGRPELGERYEWSTAARDLYDAFRYIARRR
jgi:beta-1,4-mannosyltransferase